MLKQELAYFFAFFFAAFLGFAFFAAFFAPFFLVGIFLLLTFLIFYIVTSPTYSSLVAIVFFDRFVNFFYYIFLLLNIFPLISFLISVINAYSQKYFKSFFMFEKKIGNYFSKNIFSDLLLPDRGTRPSSRRDAMI